MDKTNIDIQEVKDAIAKAEKLFPNDWQAQLVEIALIPKVNEALAKINTNRKPVITPVQTKYGPGYVLEMWNSIRDDYYSTHPNVVANGLRREFYGSQDIEFLRMIALGCDCKQQLKYFTVN